MCGRREGKEEEGEGGGKRKRKEKKRGEVEGEEEKLRAMTLPGNWSQIHSHFSLL